MVLPTSSLRCLARAAANASARSNALRPTAATSASVSLTRSSLSTIASSSYNIGVSSTIDNSKPSAVSLSSLSSSLSGLSLKNNTTTTTTTTTTKTNFFSSLPSHVKYPNGSEPVTILTLSNLTDNPGAITKARRIGRGIGSSKGKTSGRGHKGQKSRAGKGVHPTFEGGQTEFYKRLPKVGRMKNANFKLELIPLNIGRVQDYVTMGRLIPERSDGVLTMRDFVRAGMFPSSAVKSGVKLLGGGKEQVKDVLLIEVPWASASAIEAVEKKGGYVTTVHHNRLALRALLKPEKFPVKPENVSGLDENDGNGNVGGVGEVDLEDLHLLPKRARPPPKYMQYYTDYSKRGYLNPKVQLERKQRGLKEIH